MTIGLFMSLGGNVLAVIAIMVLVLKLSTTRLDLVTAKDLAADLQIAKRRLAHLCDDYLRELTGHRARAEQVRLGALRASQASAAARKAKAH